MNSTLLLGFALGMRHGTDPDHLTAIDGLARLRPRLTNGLFFALGHGLLVTLLAAGVGRAFAGRAAFLAPWLLIAIGTLNLWKLFRPMQTPHAKGLPFVAQPFLLGLLLAAEFETSSQLSVLILADGSSAWLLGAAFCLGMALVDGVDGYLAASTQNLAAKGAVRAAAASRMLGVLVIVLSYSLAGAELLGYELDAIALPLGLTLFAVVIGFRIWSRSGSGAPLGSALSNAVTQANMP